MVKSKMGELIAAVCTRPGMYVGEKRFHTVAVFLEGYLWGLPPDSAEAKEFDAFTDWLKAKLNCPKSKIWYGCLEVAFAEEDALKEFPRLYDEFLATFSND